MQGVLSDSKVIVAASETDVMGYGKNRGELSLEEAAFMLDKGKLTITHGGSELSFGEFIMRALDTLPMFTVRYLVYTDLKERGYAVKTGGVEFWLYPRGTKPGEKPAKYIIHILAERDLISLLELVELLSSARNMRKELIIAVVDEESDITYYGVNEPRFDAGLEEESAEGKTKASLVGDRVVLWDAEFAVKLFENNFYGKLTNENRLLLSLVETAYLMTKNRLVLEASRSNHAKMSFVQFLDYAGTIETIFSISTLFTRI